jgi:hypothetical protein
VTAGERFTSNLPRIAGSDLREARACAASAATEGGEAKNATIAAMGGMAEAPGTATGSADQAPTYLAEGGERVSRRGRIRLRSSERTLDEGDQAGGDDSSAMDAGRESSSARELKYNTIVYSKICTSSDH